GVGAVTLLLVHGVAVAQRRLLLGTPFVVVWWGYSMVAAGATVVTWLLSSWLADAMIDPRPALFSFLLDLGVFPAVAYVFARAQRSVLRRG
ncbi:MAG TPA: rod shape-determining protein MreD, partial [Dongiaceae bacterium]|nr:rod shape-determining protein MreD [Dongiaceae bacterium]